MKDKTIWDLLADINYNKVPWEDQLERDKKLFSPYMINRFLSMDVGLIDMVNEVQTVCITLEPEYVYNVYLDILPKRKFFAKYIGTKVKVDTKLVDFLKQYIDLSKRELEEMIQRLDASQLKEELSKFGLSDKQIKKDFKL